MNMKLLALSLLLCVGCSGQREPELMFHTHKVWRGSDFMSYQGPDGLGCANITRSENGYVYSAKVINWSDPKGAYLVEPFSDFNTLEEAERFAEKWCKP